MPAPFPTRLPERSSSRWVRPEGAELARRIAGELPADWESKLPSYTAGTDPNKATRQWSQLVLNDVASAIPEIIGGSADLTPSNLTALNCSGDFQKDTP